MYAYAVAEETIEYFRLEGYEEIIKKTSYTGALSFFYQSVQYRSLEEARSKRQQSVIKPHYYEFDDESVKKVTTNCGMFTHDTFYYRGQNYKTHLAANIAQSKYESNRNKVSYTEETKTTLHAEDGQVSIIEVCKKRNTIVREAIVETEVISKVFNYLGVNYDSLSAAKLKRQQDKDRYKDNLITQIENLIATSKNLDEESSNDLLFEACFKIQEYIGNTPGADTDFRISKLEKKINQEFTDLQIACGAKSLYEKLDTFTIENRIKKMQQIKNMYAQAMADKPVKIEFYREKRAQVSQELKELENAIQEKALQEDKLHKKAKSLYKKAQNEPSTENFELALDVYNKLLKLKTLNNDDYAKEKNKVVAALDAHQKNRQYVLAHQLALVASQSPSQERFVIAINAFKELIKLNHKDKESYKAELKAIEQEFKTFNAEEGLRVQAEIYSFHARQHPSIQNYEKALNKYKEVIQIALHKTPHKVEHAKLELEMNEFTANLKHIAIESIVNMKLQLVSKNPEQRIALHQAIIEYCQQSPIVSKLNDVIQKEQEAIELEEQNQEKTAEAKRLIASLSDVDGDSRTQRYQLILDKLAEVINTNPPEITIHKALRAEIKRAQQNFISMQAILSTPINLVQQSIFNFQDDEILEIERDEDSYSTHHVTNHYNCSI